MKVIKLDRRYQLFKRGYTFAIMSESKFDAWLEMRKVQDAARDLLGDQYANCYDHKLGAFNGPWTSGHFARSSKHYKELGNRLYVAVKREQDLSMILLKAQV